MTSTFSSVWNEAILQSEQAKKIKAGFANPCGGMETAFVCTTKYSVGLDVWFDSGLVCGISYRYALEKTYVETENQLADVDGLKLAVTCQAAN